MGKAKTTENSRKPTGVFAYIDAKLVCGFASKAATKRRTSRQRGIQLSRSASAYGTDGYSQRHQPDDGPAARNATNHYQNERCGRNGDNEIAEIMSMSENAVTVNLSRARKKLREMILIHQQQEKMLYEQYR